MTRGRLRVGVGDKIRTSRPQRHEQPQVTLCPLAYKLYLIEALPIVGTHDLFQKTTYIYTLDIAHQKSGRKTTQDFRARLRAI